jgi:uncharacterized protein
MPRGTRRLPAKCLKLLEAADLILHAGDFVSAAVLDALSELAPVEAVVGNMDEEEVRHRLPERRVVEVESVRIGMVHDAGPALGRAERLVAAFPGCSAVVYGHTHVPEATRLRETWILNPGSPTERRAAPHHGMIGLTVSKGRLDVRTYVL